MGSSRNRFAEGVVAALCGGSLCCGAVCGAVGSASLLGCASQQDTATALAVAGTAAVIVGASMAADDGQCYSSAEGGPPYCSPGLSRAARHAGTATAIAGAGVAGAGYALQPKGPDQNQHPHGAPSAPPSYRLVRPPPEPEAQPEIQPTAGTSGSDPSAAVPEGAPEERPGTAGASVDPTAAPGTSSPTGASSNSAAPPASNIDPPCGPNAGQSSTRAVPEACKAAPPPAETP